MPSAYATDRVFPSGAQGGGEGQSESRTPVVPDEKRILVTSEASPMCALNSAADPAGQLPRKCAQLLSPFLRRTCTRAALTPGDAHASAPVMRLGSLSGCCPASVPLLSQQLPCCCQLQLSCAVGGHRYLMSIARLVSSRQKQVGCSCGTDPPVVQVMRIN